MDELYDMILDYARTSVIPQFCEELKRNGGSIKRCPGYKELRVISRILNIIAPHVGPNGTELTSPTKLIHDAPHDAPKRERSTK